MEIKVLETTIIHPSQQPFHHDHILSLSHLDTDRNMRGTFRYVRAYSANDTTPNIDPFYVITAALSAVLVKYYPFSGSLRRREKDGRFELICSASSGVPIIRAVAVDCSMESVNYLNSADDRFLEQLVHDPDVDEWMVNPLTLKVTGFSCGGFTLGATVHHALCDGLGATMFFNAMADIARGGTGSKVEPVWDRVKLLGPREPPRIEFPIHEFLSLDEESKPYLELSEPVVREYFFVKDEWLDRFKGHLQERSGLSFTTFEALGAFLWQSRIKASNLPRDEKVKFAYSLNIRRVMKPPLPAGYWGNGCVPMYVQLTVKDLVEQPIWDTAELIKKSKRNATTEYVHSFIDFQELNYEKGITAGKSVSAFIDWRHLGHSTVDFGWGGPITVLPILRNIQGGVQPCFFLPSTDEEKDGFKVLLYVHPNALAGFRADIEKFNRMEYC